MREIEKRFAPTPPQRAFLNSKAAILGYGGAVGGGKSRGLCEWAFRLCMKHPGIQVLIARLEHTQITETTRKTMLEQVIPPPLITRKRESQGEDWIEIVTPEPGVTSKINFIGFQDSAASKWYSSEIGAFVVDEAHQVEVETVTQFLLRLRQRCVKCIAANEADCVHMPHRAAFGFNPAEPGHWLQEWFILGSAQTEFGFYKPDLYLPDADEDAPPFGDAEFVIARPADNPFLSKIYKKRLDAQPVLWRRRMVLGEWVLIGGSMFFDADALTEYAAELKHPWKTGTTAGDLSGANPQDPMRVILRKHGPLAVWKPPVRKVLGLREAHRYIISVDVSSGGGADFTGIQVIDIEEFEQVAELQVKMDPDLAAIEAYRLACIYNGATIVPEVTGGMGLTIVRVVRKLNMEYKGPKESMPRLYQRVIGENEKLGRDYSEKYGWDTNVRTRMLMLDLLEEVIRERSFKLNGVRTHTELTHFARDKKTERPSALSGKHDDLTISLAIGVYVAVSLPKQLRRVRQQPHKALVAGTGY